MAVVSSAHGQGSYVNFEGKQTRPICLSPDGTRLFAVNTPDARLSVFDVSHPSSPFLIAEIPVGVEPVSVNVQNNDEAWVVNEVSDSISVVSVSNRIVMDTIYAKDEPVDVVFAGGRAFVSESRNNQMAVFDATNHQSITNIALFGENPRALVVNSNSTKVYVAFALSGNHTTIVPFTNAPPQITNAPPMATNLPAPPQVGLIVDASDTNYAPSVIQYTMPDNDVAEVDVAALTITRYFPHVGTVNLGLAVRPGSGDLYVANTDARNLTHFETNLLSFYETNQISHINISSGTVTRFDLDPGFVPFDFTLDNRSNALAMPTAVVFDPGGTNLYVAAYGSDRIASVNADSGAINLRVELCPTATGAGVDPRNKRGPRGLALNAAAQRLYVLNRIANTISIIDTGAGVVLKEIPTGSYDPTPAVIRNGRGFLFDAKLSGNGTVSCASCHIDAEMDRLAWDLGDPQGTMVSNQTLIPISAVLVTNFSAYHPMKGPMTTQTLRGLNGLAPLHWRGDRTNFMAFNPAFAVLMGGTPLNDADIAAYQDYANTITFEPNPNQNLDRTLPTTFNGADPNAGFRAFTATNYTAGLMCNTCHALPNGTARFILAAAALRNSQDMKVPQLRNLYQKSTLNNQAGANSIGGFGYLHDGSFANLFTFLSQPLFGNFSNDSIVKSNLQAFLLCFDTGTAPAVGYTRTLVSTNVNAASSDWLLLESQAAETNIDLIAKGTVGGQVHGLLFQPASDNYLPDTTNLPAFTRAQLVANIQAGDTLTIMGVPPGSGRRMGIDRNEDGILDADTPPPVLLANHVGKGINIQWPLGAVGYRLESSSFVTPATWAGDTNAVEIIGSQNSVSNSAPAARAGFYRLHFTAQ